MPYTLPDLARDLRRLLSEAAAPHCAEGLCEVLGRALRDEDFISEHLPDRAAGAPAREILYEDPELGFCICGHVHGGEAIGQPHDHGPSWAIYGQARGTTEMTDWRIVAQGDGHKPSLVEAAETYTLRPGDARFYDVGHVHSPRRTAPTRLIRIEGRNLDTVTRSNIAAAPT